jgi:hypothetical protein
LAFYEQMEQIVLNRLEGKTVTFPGGQGSFLI